MTEPGAHPDRSRHAGALRKIASLGYTACVLATGVLIPEAQAVSPVRQLTVGVPAALPGYEVLDDSHLKINDPAKRSLMDCVSGKLNAQITWLSYPTRRVIQMLQAQELDMIFPMGFTAERAASMLQSSPMWQNPDVLVSMRPVDMRDKSLRIVARLGSPQHADYLAEGYASVSGAYSYEELPRLLARAQVDVVVVPRSIYGEQKNLWPPGSIVTDGRSRMTGIYLSKQDPKGLLKPLNESIGRCKASVGKK
ncbi:transporter substrate-binding domain-containing protein [Rhodoferax sp. GW822-FHT02A01]|uniref:substrate-binding periplasmic protein n=1 Tax=Rhodoferax sp. GW822-FHT02A01 TaxID=3141537 RepID=UPI00315D2B20